MNKQKEYGRPSLIMKNLILLSTLSIPIEYIGLFLLLMLCFIIVLEINSRGK